MDSSEFPAGRPSPRRELQGPRPAPLKVRKDSYKVKKPPIAPVPSRPPPPPQHRAPVIIYAVSPKIIHTNPTDFMTIVQRLTGPTAAAAEDDPASLPSPSYAGGALSPAARLATFEKTAHASDSDRHHRNFSGRDDADHLDVGTSGAFPGILSPVPSSLPPISPGFFSPSVDLSFVSSFLYELSPAAALHGNKSFMPAEGNFLASPNNFLTTPTLPSPGAYWDLFNQFQDP